MRQKSPPKIIAEIFTKMASFRRSLPELMEGVVDSSPENSPSLIEMDGEESDEEAEHSRERALELALEKQGSTTLKRKAGRKASWPEESVNDVVDIVCENENYRRRLIFTNNKASKNLDIYKKIVALVKSRMQDRDEVFNFTPEQTRTKFKSCVAACKKASMTRKTGSGLANFMQNQPNWFKKLFPYVASRDSCNPSLAQEPSFEKLSATVDEIDGDESSNSKTNSTNCSDEEPGNVKVNNKDLYVPVPQKRMKKESTSAILKEAVSAFNKFASADQSEALIKF